MTSRPRWLFNVLRGLQRLGGRRLFEICRSPSRLLQRPDDAIHRGYDKQTELDFTRPDNFFSNYEPHVRVREQLIEDSIGFYQFTEPMQGCSDLEASEKPGYFVRRRTAAGRWQAQQNPRYLQVPDLVTARAYLTEMATAATPLAAGTPGSQPSRRHAAGPAQQSPRGRFGAGGVQSDSLPGLAGVVHDSLQHDWKVAVHRARFEGALTKVRSMPATDHRPQCRARVVVLTGHALSRRRLVGPHVRVDHDISLLVPELWCRMTPEERDPRFLLKNEYLEKCEDFEYGGRRVLASRLGVRINARFVNAFFARVFNQPHAVLTEKMLRPELQSLEIFVEGIDNIIATQKRVAQLYFNDGSVAQPP